MKSIQNIKLTMGSTIRDALKIIDSGAMQIALVVDDDSRLLGTITDVGIVTGKIGRAHV